MRRLYQKIYLTIIVSLFTVPRAIGELEGLVYGTTRISRDLDEPWQRRPAVLAVIVAVLMVGLNLLYW